jgi:progranulin
MRARMGISALPATLLSLLACCPHQINGETHRWPYNLPANHKYYPEDEVFVRRDEALQQKLQRAPVAGVKKMSDDEGEKFYLDYWNFAAEGDINAMEDEDDGQQIDDSESRFLLGFNHTRTGTTMPPFSVHSNDSSVIRSNMLSRYVRFPILHRSQSGRRDFQCPVGTSSCASIGRPNSCCAEGQTCQSIQDTGLGDVGCCAAGETCGGSLSTCASGYTECPNYPGGGCCIPGYVCVAGGCLLSSTATVIVSPSPPSTQQSSVTSRTASAATTPASQSPTVTTMPTSSTAGPSNTLACSSGFRSCPASLGGGCCPTDRACGRDVCPELTSTATVAAPVRPTSGNATPISEASITGCPTGFYACSAIYQGGCCRLGRDCAPTSCPTNALATLIDNNGVTIIVTASSGLTANSILTGVCATGWSSCAANDGGGCCPTGFVCGSSCTATATVSGIQASVVGKLAPNGAIRSSGRCMTVCVIALALLVIIFSAV